MNLSLFSNGTNIFNNIFALSVVWNRANIMINKSNALNEETVGTVVNGYRLFADHTKLFAETINDLQRLMQKVKSAHKKKCIFLKSMSLKQVFR